MNVVPMWGGNTPEEREHIASALVAAAESARKLRETFAQWGRVLEANAGRMAAAQALARQRREWDTQHAQAVKGDGDAVLYLLRHPRP